MQLDRAEAIVEALVGDIEKLRGVPEGDRAGIGGNTVPGSADDLVERQAGDLGGEVPEGDVDRAERIEWQLLDPVDFPDLAPEMLFQQGILTDEDVPQSAVDQIDHDRAAGGVCFAGDPFIGANRDLGGDGVRLPNQEAPLRQTY